jgi:tetratricopeptide (TPR) repeat protein
MTANKFKQHTKDRPSYDIHAAIALHRAGHLQEAENAYQSLLRPAPNDFDVNHMYTLFLWDAGRKNDALIQFKKTIKLDPKFAPAHYNFGCLLIETENYREAVESLSNAIALSPHSDQLYLARGNAYRFLSEFEEAAKNYRDAIALNLRFTEAWSNLGYVLNQLHRYEEALNAYQAALEIDPERHEIHINKANVLRALNRYDEALECCERAEEICLKQSAVTKQNELVDVIINRTKIYQDLENHEMALQILNRYSQNNIKILTLKANILRDTLKFDEASKIYEECLALDPENANVNWHKSLMDLSLGHFREGWRGYEYRYNVDGFHTTSGGIKSIPENYIKKFPTIHDVDNRNIYIILEQGIGDQVMFLSILPDLKNVAKKITCQVDDRLVRIFSFSYPDIDFVSKQDIPPANVLSDYAVIRMGSLPHIFRSNRSDFIGLPYLRPSTVSVQHFRSVISRLQQNDGPKIGVSWKGGTSLSRAKDRSIKLEQLLKIFRTKRDVNFYSIQHGDFEKELQNIGKEQKKNFHALPAESITDIDNLCSLIENMDLVVSVQNTNVHLAGAIGKKCLAMINSNPEWRYGHTEEVLPWYKSVKLIRQTQPGKWDKVFQSLQADLATLIR